MFFLKSWKYLPILATKNITKKIKLATVARIDLLSCINGYQSNDPHDTTHIQLCTRLLTKHMTSKEPDLLRIDSVIHHEFSSTLTHLPYFWKRRHDLTTEIFVAKVFATRLPGFVNFCEVSFSQPPYVLLLRSHQQLYYRLALRNLLRELLM